MVLSKATRPCSLSTTTPSRIVPSTSSAYLEILAPSGRGRSSDASRTLEVEFLIVRSNVVSAMFPEKRTVASTFSIDIPLPHLFFVSSILSDGLFVLVKN